MSRFEFGEDIVVIPPPVDAANYYITSGAADALSAVPEGKRLEVVVHTTEPESFAGRLTTWDAVRTFLWGGHAVFTLRSTRTGMRYTYRVKVKKKDVLAKLADLTYFVEVLRGPDNGSDFAYMGVLRKPAQFNFTHSSRVGRVAESSKALLWFLDKLEHERDVLTTEVEFWHSGRCGRCGRALTVPESIASGFGDVCAGKER
jgi:hypothetical protein